VSEVAVLVGCALVAKVVHDSGDRSALAEGVFIVACLCVAVIVWAVVWQVVH
jgi:hypothetical protein